MTGDSGGWHPTRRSDAYDVALAALLGIAAAISLYIGGDAALFGEMSDYSRPVGIALTVLCMAPLAVRRRFPLASLVVTTAAFVPLFVIEVPELSVRPLALFIALYTAGAYGRRRRDAVRGAAVVTIVGLVAWALATRSDGYEGTVSLALVNALTAFQNIFYLVAAWILGDLIRNRREREATLERQADELRAMEGEAAARAVLDERVRIARELHDVVAHHVSVMGVQAGAARRVLASRPEEVPGLLTAIEESSRLAVGELAQLLGLLRNGDGREGDDANGPGVDEDGPGTARRAGTTAVAGPQPTLADLDDLTGQMREAGLALVTDVDPAVRAADALPPAVALSAYRIVQEALTNTLRHAGRGTAVRVDVVLHAGALEIAVRDDGHGTAGPPGSGHGLAGMRERVALVGGELRTGRGAGGGYEVRAWLPIDGRRRAAGADSQHPPAGHRDAPGLAPDRPADPRPDLPAELHRTGR